MKNVFLVFVFLFVLVGCASQSNVNSPGTACASVPNDKYLECLSKQDSMKTVESPAAPTATPTEVAPTAPTTSSMPTQPPPATKPRPKPSDTPELPVFDPQPPPKVNPPFPPGMPTSTNDMFVTPDFLPIGDKGCMPGHSLSIHNDSNKFVEVTGDDLRPCGDGNLVAIYISQANGSVRIAYVIPPDEIGTYYFYPWRDVAGVPVTTNGRKNYTIRVFDAGSIKGLSAATPAAQIVVIRDHVTTPFSANWWKRIVDNHDIDAAIAMK